VVRGFPDFYRPVRVKGYQTEIFAFWGSLDPGGTKTLLDMSGMDISLEVFEAATNLSELRFLIEAYNADGTLGRYLVTALKDGTSITFVTPATIHDNESILWYELIYDTTNNYYKFGLGYPLRFTNGLRIHLINPSATASANYALHGCIAIRS